MRGGGKTSLHVDFVRCSAHWYTQKLGVCVVHCPLVKENNGLHLVY